MPAKKKDSSATLLVKQIGSPIRRNAVQREHLIALGLNKMNRVKELQDNPIVRGLIEKVKHLVAVQNSK